MVQKITINRDSNYNEVQIGDVTLYFSYDTLIAFKDKEGKLVARDNQWGSTTGKHLSKAGSDKKERLSEDDFERELEHFLLMHRL